jgi:O-antigen/teichoic acid export membrane protein
MIEAYLSNVMAQGVGRFMTMSANFAAYVLLARFFGPDILGKYIYILNFIAIAGILVEFGTTSVMSKQLAQVQRNEACLYWGNFLALRVFVFIAFLGPVLGIAFILRPNLFIFLFWCILALPFLASRFFEPVYQIYKRPWYSALSNGCYSIVWFLIILVVIFCFRTLEWIIAGYIFSNILYTVLAFYLASDLLRPKLRININYMKNILQLALPLCISSIFSILNVRIGIFMLSSMQSDIAVGLYSVPFRFFEMAATLGMVLMYPLIPIFSKIAQSDLATLKKIFARILESVAIIIMPVAIMAPLFTETIIQFFFGPKFVETTSTLNVIVWIGMLLFLNLLSSALNLSLGVVRHGYWNTALALILTVTLNYIWIPEYGYLGCAWSALVSEFLLFCITLFYSLKSIGNFINYLKWFYILGANAVFFVCLYYNVLNLHFAINIILAVCIYVAIIFLTKLIDKSALTSIYNQIKANNC